MIVITILISGANFRMLVGRKWRLHLTVHVSSSSHLHCQTDPCPSYLASCLSTELFLHLAGFPYLCSQVTSPEIFEDYVHRKGNSSFTMHYLTLMAFSHILKAHEDSGSNLTKVGGMSVIAHHCNPSAWKISCHSRYSIYT